MADEKLISKVKETLDAFRPQLNADGGDMEFICIDDDNKVHLKLTGACGSCPMATMTLKMGIERYLKEVGPESTEVIQDEETEKKRSIIHDCRKRQICFNQLYIEK